MFGMSFVELSIVAIVALLLLGPDQLPGVARTIGKGLRDLRRASDDLKQTFEQEMVKLETEVNRPPKMPKPIEPLRESTDAASAVVDVKAIEPSRNAMLGAGASVLALDQARQSLSSDSSGDDPGALRAQARAASLPLDPGAARAAARALALAPKVVAKPIIATQTIDVAMVATPTNDTAIVAMPIDSPGDPLLDRAAVIDSTSIVVDISGNLLPDSSATAASAEIPAAAKSDALASADEFTPLRQSSGPAISLPKTAPLATVPRNSKPDNS